MRHGRKEKQLVTSDLSNHGTTSLDVMTTNAKIFGFLAVKSIPAQTYAHILVTKGAGLFEVNNRDMLAFCSQRKLTLICLST